MAGVATNWGSYIRRELNSINAASRATDLKTLREIVDTLRVVVNRCCAAEENAEGLEEPPPSAQARLVAPEQGAEPYEFVRNGNVIEPPPPPPVAAAGGAPRFATAANRATARGGVPPPSGALATRAGRLAPNMEGCNGVTPEDCRVARVKLGRANSQLAAYLGAGGAAGGAAGEAAGGTANGAAGEAAAAQSGGKRRSRSRTKKKMRVCNYRRTNRR